MFIGGETIERVVLKLWTRHNSEFVYYADKTHFHGAT